MSSSALLQLPAVSGVPSYTTVAGGENVRIIQLNNAATTPPFERTLEEVNAFMRYYGALHRGAGPRARMTCQAIDEAIASIREFVGASEEHALLFTQNTSAAINVLARLLHLSPGDAVLTSEIEHTSNNLPWRYNTPAEIVEVRASNDGELDYGHLAELCEERRGRVKVISISGASNLTGYVADLPRLGRIAHNAEALFFVDAAQLAPHRRIDMRTDGIDALAFSAHKLYAPFGLGVLVLPLRYLTGIPIDPGGGSIDMISAGEIVWSPVLQRHQTGTWNATGIVALGASCRVLEDVGWENVNAHEEELVAYMLRRLERIPALELHVAPARYIAQHRIGTVPFTLNGYHYALLGAVLEHEYGVEVRAGTICNHRLVRRWFEISDEDQKAIEDRIAAGDRLASYGIVRASIGLYNTPADVDALAEALDEIADHGPRRRYHPIPQHEAYAP